MKKRTSAAARTLRALSGCLMLSLLFGLRSKAAGDDVRDRLNKILYWHLADDLKLAPPQEKEMSAIIEDIQAKRQAALAERDASIDELRKLGKAPAPGSADGALKKYREALSRMGGLDVEEYERLRKLFGAETLARYYVVREEVLSRVREALKSSESKK